MGSFTRDMRAFLFILNCFAAGIVGLAFVSFVGNAIGYALFRTVFAGLGYDTALPVSICVGFGIALGVAFLALRFLWKRIG